MKKKLLLLTPLMLGLMLSACGTSDTPTPTPSSEASSAETTSNQQTSSAQGTSSAAQSSSTAGQTSSAEAQSSSEATTSSSTPAVTQYTITFNSKGGSDVTAITQNKGSSISKPTDPERNGYNFVGWSYDEGGSQPVEWPVTLNSNLTMYANWNEKVNIKDYLKTLIQTTKQDPYSYIPEAMRSDYEDNFVEEANVTYDFNSFKNVSGIKYGGFGEQWNMVLENIQESENFYKVLTIGETLINASVVLFNNYLDNNTSDTGTHSLNETEYTAKLSFSNAEIKYSIRYKTNMNIPFFGEVTPQVDMSYQLVSGLRSVRIQLNETNALKYEVGASNYTFAISYGVTAVSRKAYFEVNNNNGEIDGHIYEFVQYKDKELVPSAADFYINDNYVSVVGNKADGLIGFTGYINELYKTDEGKLLGYEVREEKSSLVYNTLWFNLNNITGINNIKYIDSDHAGNESDIGFYVNNSASKFESKNVGGLSLKSLSRRYDIEFRTQYFYGLDNEDKLVEYKTSIPMMFIQEEVFDSFSSDVSGKNSGLTVSVNLNTTYLEKIKEDYGLLIDIFVGNKEMYDGDYITDYIGTAEVIA